MALREDKLLVNPHAVIRHCEFEHFIRAPRGNEQAPRVRMFRNAVANRILHQLLQGETGNQRGQERASDVELSPQPVREARLFDGDVLPDEFEFFAEWDFIRAMAAERRSQDLAQLFDDAHGGLTLVVAHHHGDGVERVEEKVRVHLRLQRGETRARQLLGKTRQLHVALARFDEVTNGVLDADDAQVHGDAERQRDEDPAQPIHADRAKKLRRPDSQRRAHRLRIEHQPQPQLEQFAACRPGDAEQQRQDKMQERVPHKTRSGQGQAFREAEDCGREQAVKQPIAAFPQQIARRHWIPAVKPRLGDAIDGGESGGRYPCRRNEHPWFQ
ncbi:MAG: hypothetical protein JMDDDDMK_02850 [Acidobacteria bacterium]|nr:hypothetical protein [Acidobacteriota bacterium]